METKGLNMKLSKIIVTGLAVLSCGCLVQSVNAIPTLTLSDGTTTIIVTDGSAMDKSSIAGAVVFDGIFGNLSFNVSTGLTKPLSGTASAPSIDLNAVVMATGATTLTITLSETAILTFGARGGMTSFDAAGTVPPSVPDGGMTLTMLGIGLLAVGAASRIYRVARV